MRAVYTKTGLLVYLSHLDIVRIVERAMRRAGIQMTYTEGFHPMAKITFSPPISLGMTSYGEVLEAHLVEEIDAGEFAERMNACLPPGCEILSAKGLNESDKKMSKCTMYATYDIMLERAPDADFLKQIIASEECLVIKKNKKGRDVQIDIRDKIAALRATRQGFEAELNASHEAMLSPVLLLTYMKSRNPDMPQVTGIIKKKVEIME